MALDDRDIIQIDATIITGALIFLTLTSISPTDFEKYIYIGNVSTFANVFFLVIFTTAIIIPFSSSAILSATGHLKAGRRIMITGFIIVILEFVAFLGFLLYNYSWLRIGEG